MIEAAGERIVAFARPGKPPVIPFLRPVEPGPGTANPGTFVIGNGF